MTSVSSSSPFDCVILGAGASGLMCAWQCALRGRRVAVVDHAKHCGRKVKISGGGKCNFTNLRLTAADYLCSNPHFVKSALAQYRPEDFVSFMEQHRLPVVDMGRGMLFSKSAEPIVASLENEAREAGAVFFLACRVNDVRQKDDGFEVSLADLATGRNIRLAGSSLVLACGGLAWPQIGATNLGYRIAKSFGLKSTPLHPGLVPLVAPPQLRLFCSSLAGVSLPVRISGAFASAGELLFTHKGLSGPAVLDASLGWQEGLRLSIDFLPELDISAALSRCPRMELKNALGMLLPRRLAGELCALHNWTGTVASFPKKRLLALDRMLHAYPFAPSGTGGYAKAEVTVGGVDTRQLSSKNMEAKNVPGLFLTGEVLDVAGRLGGYNLQWAWSSGYVAGQYA